MQVRGKGTEERLGRSGGFAVASMGGSISGDKRQKGAGPSYGQAGVVESYLKDRLIVAAFSSLK